MFHRLKIQPLHGITVKNEVNPPIKANAPGRLDFFQLKKAPGRFFSRFDERKAPCGEPMTREGVRKGPATEAERGTSQHVVGGIARVVSSFSTYLSIISSFFLLWSRPVDSTRPDQQYFISGNAPGAPSARFFCEKRPGGAISELF